MLLKKFDLSYFTGSNFVHNLLLSTDGAYITKIEIKPLISYLFQIL